MVNGRWFSGVTFPETTVPNLWISDGFITFAVPLAYGTSFLVWSVLFCSEIDRSLNVGWLSHHEDLGGFDRFDVLLLV
jgi:hypothetical protein